MGFLSKLLRNKGGDSGLERPEVGAPTPRQLVDGNGLSCRGWVEQVEPNKVPGFVPVELTVEPLAEGIRISLGSAYSEPINPGDMFGGALQIGAFHSLSGRGSNEPFLLSYADIRAIAGRVMLVEKTGNATRRETIETTDAPRTEPLPKGKTFEFDITYRPPARDESMVKLTLVADQARSTEDPGLTLALFNRIAKAAAHPSTSLGEAVSPPPVATPASPAPASGAEETMPVAAMYDSGQERLVDELVSIGRTTGYLPRREGRTRDIGAELDRIGGIELMRAAHERINSSLGNVKARELESAWGGIGQWRS